jgi:hypothetical protein
MYRHSTGRDYLPSRVELRRCRPRNAAGVQSVLSAPLYFVRVRNQLVFDYENLELLHEGGNRDVAQHKCAITLQYSSQVERGIILARVLDVLTQRLASGELVQQVAELSTGVPAPLQCKLGEHGIMYKEVLDATRHELALANPSASLYTVRDVTICWDIQRRVASLSRFGAGRVFPPRIGRTRSIAHVPPELGEIQISLRHSFSCSAGAVAPVA